MSYSQGYNDGYRDGASNERTTSADRDWSASLGRRARAPFRRPWDDAPGWVERNYGLPSDAVPEPTR